MKQEEEVLAGPVTAAAVILGKNFKRKILMILKNFPKVKD